MNSMHNFLAMSKRVYPYTSLSSSLTTLHNWLNTICTRGRKSIISRCQLLENSIIYIQFYILELHFKKYNRPSFSDQVREGGILY